MLGNRACLSSHATNTPIDLMEARRAPCPQAVSPCMKPCSTQNTAHNRTFQSRKTLGTRQKPGQTWGLPRINTQDIFKTSCNLDLQNKLQNVVKTLQKKPIYFTHITTPIAPRTPHFTDALLIHRAPEVQSPSSRGPAPSPRERARL